MTVAAGMERLAFIPADSTRVVNSATSAAGHRETNPLLGVPEFFGVGHIGWNIGLAGCASDVSLDPEQVVIDEPSEGGANRTIDAPAPGGRTDYRGNAGHLRDERSTSRGCGAVPGTVSPQRPCRNSGSAVRNL